MKQVTLNFRDVQTDGKPMESMDVVCVCPFEVLSSGVYDVHYSAKNEQFCSRDEDEYNPSDAFSGVRFWLPSAEFDAALAEAEL